MSRLPEWLSPLPDAATVRAADAYAIESLGIPGLRLMETAASALADEVFKVAPDGPVLIVVGKGNNGGDGLALARILREHGREVEVRAACEPAAWEGDAAEMLAKLPGEGPQPLSTSAEGFSCVVDCVLGTGATGAPRGLALDATSLITAVGKAGAVTVACDVPSGVDATTGEVAGSAVKADVTVTFHAMKPGLWVNPGKDLAGHVVEADIGIPAGSAGSPQVGLITPAVIDGLPERGRSDDKFTAGSVTVVGGSPGLTGAPLLASLGAARAGAGYVTAALPASLLSASDSVPEVMGLGLRDQDECHCESGVEEIVGRTGPGRAVVVGPGIGRSSQAGSAVELLLTKVAGPVVVDADALKVYAGNCERLASASGDLVLTPHVGEMAALLDCSIEEVAGRRLHAVRDLAQKASAIVVLKGDDTLICDPNGVVAVSPGGAPALATAGTGDVLSGVVGGLLAKGVAPFHAACAGVLIHLEAGRIAGAEGPEGVLAGDVADCLPAARRGLQTSGR